MLAKAYISNVAPGWPVERQEALLAQYVPGWPDVTIYRDILDTRARQAHQAADMVDRAAMLLQTGKPRAGEVIYVASLSVLARGKVEFAEVEAAAKLRGATFKPLDGHEIFAIARIEGSRTQARENGVKAAAAKRSADAEARAKAYEDDWKNPALRTEDVLAKMGLTRNTANKYVGKRELVLKRVEAQMKRKAKREQVDTE